MSIFSSLRTRVSIREATSRRSPPQPLLLAQRLNLSYQCGDVLSLELALRLFEAPRQIVVLALETLLVLLEPLHQGGRLLHPLRQQIQIRMD